MKKRRSLLGLLVRLAVVAVACYTVYTVIAIQRQVALRRDGVAALQAERDLLSHQVARLQEELEAPIDQTTIAQMAREKLGLVAPGERVFIDIGR